MKVVHLNKDKASGTDLRDEANLLEKKIREHPVDKDLNRLMVIYRKLKEPAKELKVLNTAIKTIELKVKTRQPVFNKKIAAISNALRKMTGLADTRGNNLYEPGELTRWKKRKAALLKKKGS